MREPRPPPSTRGAERLRRLATDPYTPTDDPPPGHHGPMSAPYTTARPGPTPAPSRGPVEGCGSLAAPAARGLAGPYGRPDATAPRHHGAVRVPYATARPPPVRMTHGRAARSTIPDRRASRRPRTGDAHGHARQRYPGHAEGPVPHDSLWGTSPSKKNRRTTLLLPGACFSQSRDEPCPPAAPSDLARSRTRPAGPLQGCGSRPSESRCSGRIHPHHRRPR